MAYFTQQLINGITLGAIYGLIAIGYTMVYGIIGMINFAHGEVFMIGAFISLIGFMICSMLGITWVPLAIVLVLLIAMAVHRRLRLGGRAHRLSAVARLVPAGAADLGHRHVDRRCRTTCSSRRARGPSRCRQIVSGGFNLFSADGFDVRIALAADHHRAGDGGADGAASPG